jgi:hypothetical protein
VEVRAGLIWSREEGHAGCCHGMVCLRVKKAERGRRGRRGVCSVAATSSEKEENGLQALVETE